jgi:ComF family protein
MVTKARGAWAESGGSQAAKIRHTAYMHLLERLAAFIAPDDCLSCGRESALLCSNCLPLLPELPKRCFGCNATVTDLACAQCLQVAGLSSLQAASHYGGLSKLLVASLKFRGNQSAGRLMGDAILRRCQLPADALLVHMPATTAHVRERGYDQAQLIVRHISRSSGLPRADLLRRSGNHHQLGSNRVQRQQQLSASLSVARGTVIKNRHVLLVDDVLTTGSSLSAAALVLHQAGAQRVDAVVFAQALNNRK